MPRKTKKEKMRSAQRHLSSPSFQHPPSVSFVSADTTAQTATHTIHESDEYTGRRTDVIRIGIFTILALIFQGMLYFLLSR